MTTTIELRRDTAANWTSVNPTLALGEPGVERDTGKFKIGDGATTWNLLSYVTDRSKATGTQLAATISDFTVAGATQTINAQTGTTYTAVAGDVGKLVTLTNAAAIAVTLPTDAAAPTITAGMRIDFVQYGAGQVTFGGTVQGTPTAKTRTQYSVVSAVKMSAANTWLLTGDLAAS